MPDKSTLTYHDISEALKFQDGRIKKLEADVQSLNAENAGWLQTWQRDQSEIETLKDRISRLESEIQFLKAAPLRPEPQIQSSQDDS